MLLTVGVAEWSVTCCRPMPVEGEEYSLPLRLRPEHPQSLPEMMTDVDAEATALPPWDSGLELRPYRLTWNSIPLHYESADPLPDRVRLRGTLSDGSHGDVPVETPDVTGVVERLRVLFSRGEDEDPRARLEDAASATCKELIAASWTTSDAWQPVAYVLNLNVRTD